MSGKSGSGAPQAGPDLWTVGTDLDLTLTGAAVSIGDLTEDPRSSLKLIISQAQHYLTAIEGAQGGVHAMAVACAAACQRLSGTLEAAKSVAVSAAYSSASEMLIESEAVPGGYRRHGLRSDDDCTDRYLSRRQLAAASVGPALGVSLGQAGALVDRSRRLVSHLPNALTRAACGDWSRYHLKRALDALEPASDEQAGDADAALHARAGEHPTPARVASRIDAWAIRNATAEPALDQRDRTGLEGRRVDFSATDVFGMRWMSAYLPDIEARAIQIALGDYAAHAHEDDPRTNDQRRADVLLAMLPGPAVLAPDAVMQMSLPPVTFDVAGMPRSVDPQQYAAAQDAWEAVLLLMASLGMHAPAPPKTVLNVDVPMSMLLNLRAGIVPGTGAHAPPTATDTTTTGAPLESRPVDDSGTRATDPTGTTATGDRSSLGAAMPAPIDRDRYAWVEGIGSISHTALVRLLAGEPDLRRLITDDFSGVPLELGPIHRHPNTVMRRRVQLRDRTCRFPYCTQHAVSITGRQADLDHAVAFRSDGTGGPTADANLIVLCRAHHRAKHQSPWTPDVHPDATITWHNALTGWTITSTPKN